MSSPPVAQLIVVSCVPTATRIVSAWAGANIATVMATMATLNLKELNSIITSLKNNELEKLVDYNTPLGTTKSWYRGKVSLSGFESLAGQDMMGYLTFNATLSGSIGDNNESMYNELVRQIEVCVGAAFSKKTEDKRTWFINKKDQDLKIDVDYINKERPVNISITNASAE